MGNYGISATRISTNEYIVQEVLDSRWDTWMGVKTHKQDRLLGSVLLESHLSTLDDTKDYYIVELKTNSKIVLGEYGLNTWRAELKIRQKLNQIRESNRLITAKNVGVS